MTDNLMKEQEQIGILEKEDKIIDNNNINMILSQTNYDKIMAIEKLKIFNDPIEVIKDYLTDGNSNVMIIIQIIILVKV